MTASATGVAIGSTLRQLREAAKMTQAEVGAAIGVHRNTVYRYEGDGSITLELLLKLCPAVDREAADVLNLLQRTIGDALTRKETKWENGA